MGGKIIGDKSFCHPSFCLHPHSHEILTCSRPFLCRRLVLGPTPPRTDLKAVVTGRIEQDTFTVENLHFQSMPHLYVTANLYVPKGLTNRAPAILYLCGHGPVISNGVSFGNKVF